MTPKKIQKTIRKQKISPQEKGVQPQTQQPFICLLGDEQLVKEYSALFQDHGIAVLEVKNLATVKNSAKKITAAFELSIAATDQRKKFLSALNDALPVHVPIVSNCLTETLLTQSHELQHRERFLGIAAFPTLIANALVELTASIYTSKTTADAVQLLFTAVKKETVLVQDSVGMVMPRILCQLVNEALFTVQYDIASPVDIDDAMKLGTNYPHGPIEWGEQAGFSNVVAVLDALYHHHHEERYKVAPLLRQMAVAGVFWK